MNGSKMAFVYNADSNLFSAVTGFAHKILSPSTYQCNLCALTYGSFLIKQEWKLFVDNLPIETIFLYKDEFEKQYNANADLPAVFLLKDETINVLIIKQEIESCKSLEALKNLVTQKLDHVQHHHSNI